MSFQTFALLDTLKHVEIAGQWTLIEPHAHLFQAWFHLRHWVKPCSCSLFALRFSPKRELLISGE